MLLTKKQNRSNEDFFDTVSHFSNRSTLSSFPVKRKLSKNSSEKVKSIIRNDPNNNRNEHLKGSFDYQVNSNDLNTISIINRKQIERRSKILSRPNETFNFELAKKILKNAIGKDLSKIPVPCNFSEPISFLQRITEALEYSNLLDKAAQCTDPIEQMAYVAAFSVSSYSTAADRLTKPFNPMIGETFEFNRLDDLGWRSIGIFFTNIKKSSLLQRTITPVSTEKYT